MIILNINYILTQDCLLKIITAFFLLGTLRLVLNREKLLITLTLVRIIVVTTP